MSTHKKVLEIMSKHKKVLESMSKHKKDCQNKVCQGIRKYVLTFTSKNLKFESYLNYKL